MAKACQGEQGVALFSLWEAETCIKAADLLLWPHIKQAKQTGEASCSSCVIGTGRCSASCGVGMCRCNLPLQRLDGCLACDIFHHLQTKCF